MTDCKVLKYPFSDEHVAGRVYLPLPTGARVCHFGVDPSGVLCVWAIVPREEQRGDRAFWIMFTGSELPSLPLVHRGSCVHGRLVLHLFEVT